MGAEGPIRLGQIEVFAVSLGCSEDTAIPAAASRAGATGLLNLTACDSLERASTAVRQLCRLSSGSFGVLLTPEMALRADTFLTQENAVPLIVLHGGLSERLPAAVTACRATAKRVGVAVCTLDEAERAADAGADFVLAKGHESGGQVGEETTFVLLQRLVRWGVLPVGAWGGVGWHSASAFVAGGAFAIVLDWQLALLRESGVSSALRSRIAAMDGTETAVVTRSGGGQFRLYHRPGMTARDTLTASTEADWTATAARLCRASALEDRLIPLGQDAAFARDFAAQAPSVARAVQLLCEQISKTVAAAAKAAPLAEGSSLAASHGTRYPIVQGPMTRVSDVPEFAAAVAGNGALPFLALALMRGAEAKSLLEKTRDLLGDRPWGVGVLGFAEREIRAEQLEAIESVRPPFAIIAGGRPDQAAAYESKGIATYLHVPTPGMLKMFLAEGARRFIFEGRECGGHVGPLSSSVLWNTMIRVLLETPMKPEQAAQVHVLFAGGIHDARSAAMVAAMAQPLAARGMKFGVLMGTGYLFTDEAVSSGAILPGFQRVAIESRGTLLLTTGPGHSIRCADTPYVHVFQAQRAALENSGRPHEDVRAELEAANIGRLRIASKGVTRSGGNGEASNGRELVRLEEPQQRNDGIYMLGQVTALRDARTTMAALHEEIAAGGTRALRAASDRLTAHQAAPTRRATPAPFDIAIVGMACFVPGANTVEQFWRHVLRKDDCIIDIPCDRFDVDRWYDEDKSARDKIYGKRGGFIQDIPFDPLKFGIPPTTLRHVEPLHFLALELAERALRDAGYHPYNPSRVRTGVILGVGAGAAEMSTRYAFRAMIPQFVQNPDESLWSQLPEWTEDSFAGILPNVVAGRITNRLNLGGPNYTVDAACAAGLAAVVSACRELTLGTADMVISGGADTAQNPLAFHCLSSTKALSPGGRTAAFDEAADGLVNSEGLTFFVLKRRADAERDGDRIYAIIRGAGASADAQTKGLTAPSPDGQRRALQAAYDQAGFSPSTVGLFEAHGTGTARGDVTECQSLMALLSEHDAQPRRAALGSAKSNFGHTKCNAGALGLMKAALSVYHRVLPPTIHVQTPNPKANLDRNAPVYLNSELRPWIREAVPRRAGVFAAGFGGTNFHLVIEEYDRDPVGGERRAPDRQRGSELLLLAADSRDELATVVRKLLDETRRALDSGAEFSLADLAYTVHRRAARRMGAHRAAVVARDVDELIERLEALLAALSGDGAAERPRGSDFGMVRPGAYYHGGADVGRGRVALLFPGQGSQHPEMFRDLAVEFSEAAEAFARADEAMTGRFDRPLSRFIFPPPAFTEAERKEAFEALKQTEIAQPALGAAGVAAFRLLSAFGIRADMTAGHSYGELVALHAAGALSERSLFELSYHRGQAIVSMTRDPAGGVPADLGQMLAVRGGEPAVRSLLAGETECWVANFNSPTQTVISGTRAGLARIRPKLEAAGLTCVDVPVACAFHSPIMQPARERFAQALRETAFSPAQVDVYSNTAAARYPDDVRATLSDQLVHEVQFARQIEAMYADGARVFIEAGPGSVLTRLVREVLGDRPHVAVAMQRKDEPGMARLASALAELFVAGAAIETERLYEGRDLEIIDLTALAGQGRKQYPRHFWFVNGGYCRPVTDPPRDPQPRARLVSDADDRLPVSPVAVPGDTRLSENGHAPSPEADRLRTWAAPVEAAPPSVAPNASIPATDHAIANPVFGADMAETSSVYNAFQETMREFLRTQQAVMEAFLAGGASMPAESQSVVSQAPGAPAALPAPRAAAPPPPRVVAPLAPAPVAAPPAAAVDLRAMLLDVVSQRTGYPPDMLDLSANLEADLGIDSIKRVEIVGAFRRAAVPQLAEPPAWFMEKMTSVKSLQEILDGVAALCGAWATPAALPVAEAPASPAAPAAPQLAVATVDLRAMLLEVVAQRTGYPADMLDLNVNLEADLGIDSIKRVEIVGAFRRAAVPQLAEPPAWFMEKMTSVKSLQEILDGVSALSGSGATPTPAHSAPVAPAAAPKTQDVDLRSMLLDVVAQRTGYPPDMLDLNANLEAELGIDSIKRVEIVGAFRRAALPQLAEPPPWFMEKMTGVRSLQEILDGVRRLLENPDQPDPDRRPPGAGVERAPAGKEDAAASLASPGAARSPRCVLLPAEAPAEDAPATLSDGVFLITDDGRGSARGVEAALSARGGRAVLLANEALASRDAAERAAAEIRGSGARLAGVIHLRAMQDARGFPEISDAAWRRHSDEELRSTLFLLQAVSPELSASSAASPFFFGCVTLGGGDFGDSNENEAAHPWRGGIAGLLKCAAKEWTTARFRCVDLDDAPNGALPGLLLPEIATDGPVEVGYRGGRRLVLRVARADFDPNETPRDAGLLRRGSVVLVTGGARGITAAIAQELAERFQPILVLAGRSPLPDDREDPETADVEDPSALKRLLVERARAAGRKFTPREIEHEFKALLAEREIRSNLHAMRSAGAKVEYHCCDVRDAATFEGLIRNTRGHHGRIDAVVHGAGVIEDKFIADKSADSFDRVLATKVQPLLTLCHHLDPNETRLLMLFSSVAGALGNPGQGDYAAANEILNRLARRLATCWPGKIVAMNWGAWSGAGMVTPEVARQFAERGVGMVDVPSGRLAALDEIVRDGGRGMRVLIGPGPWVAEAERGPAELRIDSPLLASHRAWRESDELLEARVQLDVERFAYLSDHRIEGKPVLPMTVAMEMMAELAAAGQPDMQVQRIHDVRQLSGVIVSRSRLDAALRAERIDLTSETAEWRVRLSDARNPGRPLYQAMVHMSRAGATPGAAPQLDALDAAFPLSPADAYRKWLFHGPAFQVVERIHGVSEKGIDATIRPGCRIGCVGRHAQRGWLVDPIALDSAPHLASLWSRAVYGTTQLPSRIASYHAYGPIGDGPLQVYLRSRIRSDGTSYHFDAWFVREGRVLGRMEGLEGAGNEALNRIAQGVG